MDRVCKVDGCNSRVLAKEMCSKHYNRMRSKGSLDAIRKNARAECVVDGCDRGATAYGYCHNHKRRAAEYQERHDARLLATRQGRLCLRCRGPIPLTRAADAIYCSTTCKNKQRETDGRARESSLRWYFKSQYGLTPEQVEEMAATGCAICGTTEWGGRHSRPAVDHDHKTGKVRGVLCSECNYGLGKFGDDPARLRAAAAYLEAHR
jgi:hypothetical protein